MRDNIRNKWCSGVGLTFCYLNSSRVKVGETPDMRKITLGSDQVNNLKCHV